MYKLVVVDLDGTILNSYGEISETTKKSVKKCWHSKVIMLL